MVRSNLAFALTDISVGWRLAIILFVISCLPLAIVWASTHRKRRK